MTEPTSEPPEMIPEEPPMDSPPAETNLTERTEATLSDLLDALAKKNESL